MNRNINLYNEAKKYIPGGVNSPVRAFKSVGGTPFFVAKAKGSKLYDVEGNQYIDYVCSWGPLILGHAHPEVVKEIKSAAENGTSYGIPTQKEIELAKLICKAIPSMEKVRLVNSGTEATMTAIRLAKGFTGKKKIVKFAGCYHGHVDSLLVSAGSGAATFGVPTSAGVSDEIIKNTIVAKYNDINSLKTIIKKGYKEIAGLIIEPIAGNMGLVLPEEGFLDEVANLCKKYDILLIFDEVITGFRLRYGGVQDLYKIKPDLTCLGKIIGGGMPIGAFGGRKEIMNRLSPEGDVYQAGTLSGNPVAVTAGLTTLKILSKNNPSCIPPLLKGDEGGLEIATTTKGGLAKTNWNCGTTITGINIYKNIQKKAEKLYNEILSNALPYHIPIRINHIGSMFTIFFTDKEVIDYETAKTSDTKKYAKFFHLLLKEGIYFPPSQFETCFVSSAHTYKDIEETIEAIKLAFKSFSLL